MTVTNTGLAAASSRWGGDGGEAAFTFIEVGTGTTAADVTDTALEAAITDSGLERAAGTASRSTTTVTNDTAELTKTFSVTGTKSVTECGIFNAASVGILGSRQVFTAVPVVNGDSLALTWKHDFS